MLSMSALGQKQTSRHVRLCPRCPQKRTLEPSHEMSAFGRFCCRSPLQAFLVSDSVAVPPRLIAETTAAILLYRLRPAEVTMLGGFPFPAQMPR
jgi:hypothetical protein